VQVGSDSTRVALEGLVTCCLCLATGEVRGWHRALFRAKVDQLVPGTERVNLGIVRETHEAALRGYLAHKKQPPPRTPQQD
jgi:hypothetical protein